MNAYFLIDPSTKQQNGPFSLDELKQKGVTAETMVWCSGMADWAAAGEVEELAPLFGGTAPAQDTPVEESKASAYGQQAQPQQTANPQQGQYTNPQQGQYANPQQGQYNNGTNGSMNQTEVRPIPKNWLVESILCTIFCCLPFGIAGIVNASKVESAYFSGDYEASERAAKNAKKWTMISFFVALGGYVLYFIFILIMSIAGSSGYYY